MEIYIRVDEDGFGQRAWLYHDEYQSYLSDEFWTADREPWLPPVRSAREAMCLMKEAKRLMEGSGAPGKVKASCWRFVRGKLVETRFAKDGRIKRTAKGKTRTIAS